MMQLYLAPLWTADDARFAGELDGTTAAEHLPRQATATDLRRESARAADRRAIPPRWRATYRRAWRHGAAVTLTALAWIDGEIG